METVLHNNGEKGENIELKQQHSLGVLCKYEWIPTEFRKKIYDKSIGYCLF